MTDRLRSVKHDGPSTRLVLEVPLNGNLDKVLRLLVDALKGNGGDSSQVIEAINNLSRKVDTFMATQEERLRALAGQVTTIQEGVDRLQAEFETFKANNPQLEDEIAGLEAAIGALASDVAPAPEPTPEPTPEG